MKAKRCPLCQDYEPGSAVVVQAWPAFEEYPAFEGDIRPKTVAEGKEITQVQADFMSCMVQGEWMGESWTSYPKLSDSPTPKGVDDE